MVDINLFCLTITLFPERFAPFSFIWDPKPCKVLEGMLLGHFSLLSRQIWKLSSLCSEEAYGRIVSQADSRLIAACWIHPVVLECFEQDRNSLLISLNPRPLSSARVQIHYSIVLCLSKCLYTSTLVVPSPLVKLTLLKPLSLRSIIYHLD